VKRPTIAKGFPETGKGWQNAILSNGDTSYHPRLPTLSLRSDLHHLPADNLPPKRSTVLGTYRLHLHHSKEGAKQTSTDCQSNQYWSPRQLVLVNICNQYWSTQRLVLVAKPAPNSIGLPLHQSPGSKPLKHPSHRSRKITNTPPEKSPIIRSFSTDSKTKTN